MKKPKVPGFAGEFGEQIKETAKAGKDQVSLGKAFNELLREIFGGAKPLTSQEKEVLEKKEDAGKRKARAQVLQQFMGPSGGEEERVYYRKQKEETMRRMEERKKVEKEAGMKILEAPKGKTQRGSAFAFLKRKKTKTERKGGQF